MRALICSVFGAYTFERVDALCADELAEIVGGALWLKDEEAEANRRASSRGRRR